jgi:hypothetical protein
MSDLKPGRYLEMWVPAPLVHDCFTMTMELELAGRAREHVLVTNAREVSSNREGSNWLARWPASCTSLSPMVVLTPADEVELRRSSVSLPGRQRVLGVLMAAERALGVDLAACEADVGSWLRHLASRYGPWSHGDVFCAYIWGATRGMEYDGGTTAAVEALEHEVFHSWFGRGVKPARAADGWIDEAFTTWATSGGSSGHGVPRFWCEQLDLDEPPVQLYPPHPWARQTPIEAYRAGARLFAGLAHLMGGAHRLRSAMAEWYRLNAGGHITTDGLAAHLQAWSGLDISPWWARYVHGRSA